MNKTPDEIKKGLRLYASELDDIVAVCDMSEAMGLLEEARNKMFEAANCIDEMDSDLSAWGDVASSPGAVEDMARENTELLQKIEQLEKERNAAVADLKEACAGCSNDTLCCNYCKYQEDDLQCHHDCKMYTKEWDWQWRGVKEGGKIG